MYKTIVIGLWITLSLALLSACHAHDDGGNAVVETVCTPSLPPLSAIDSLMWQQPDSALLALQAFAATPEADSLDAFNGHYCQLLISELLYKNYYPQTNRPALQHAVSYFDSLVREAPHPPLKGGARRAGDSKTTSNPNDQIPFLSARAHYINGVGYYERDSVVEACKEYLKALEVMEKHFGEKELVGHKTRFMALTYSRLGELFSEQFMMESAITCYENALVYCKISPTSPTGISNILYRIGKQYDKKNELEKAISYYSEALEKMTVTDNLVYRNIVASKALCDYNMGGEAKSSLAKLRYVLLQTDTEKEQLHRYLTMGGIYFLEDIYDSALFYLKSVFESHEAGLQDQAANYLYDIYERQGDRERADSLMRFLAGRKEPKGETKATISKLEDLFKTYTLQKQQKEAERERAAAIRKVMYIVVSIAAAVALAIIAFAKKRGKKLLKEQQEEANKRHAEALEAEQQAHRFKLAALSGRLKRSNKEVRELKGQIKHLDDLATNAETAASFEEEPVCRLIMNRVNEGQFKAKIECELYKSYALGKRHLLDLRAAADRHFNQFTVRLRKAYPKLTNGDIDYCCLYLLNLTHADVSALMQRSYNTVVDRYSKIQKTLGGEKPLPIVLMDFAVNHQYSD